MFISTDTIYIYIYAVLSILFYLSFVFVNNVLHILGQCCTYSIRLVGQCPRHTSHRKPRGVHKTLAKLMPMVKRRNGLRSYELFQEMIPKMIEAGTDIFRLNCSHRRGGDFERVYPLIRKTAQQMGKKASLRPALADLGPTRIQW